MNKQIQFTKMHGLGNDFIVINNLDNNFCYTKDVICKLSNRKLGIGFDQLLIVEQSKNPKLDFYYKIFNANGEEVFQCGNGARCFAHFVFLKKLINKTNIRIYTKKRIMNIYNIHQKDIIVNMGNPIFNPKKIPFITSEYKKYYYLSIDNKNIKCSIISMGNPHCIIEVKNVKEAPVKSLGSLIEKHFLFPEHTNVGFMEIINDNEINLRVYERGVGETRACGSGACAAVAVGIFQKKLKHKTKVNLLGGSLHVCWKGNREDLYLIGPSTYVYDGYFYLPS